MSQESSVKSVLEFAISQELDAYNLYIDLAESADNIETKQVLEEFAQEELGHKEKLELELIKRGQTLPVEDKPPTYSKLPIPLSISSEAEINYKELLLVAMQKEEASFRIYFDLATTIRDEESREVLLAIAEEEVKHKLWFKNEYDMRC